MGRATRWLKGLFGTTKTSSKDNKRTSNTQQDPKRCSIDSLRCDKSPGIALPKNMNLETEKDQTKHAIAVAAATAASADAAVAAARAAMVVVKLTHQGRVVAAWSNGDERLLWLAATKIQAVFRGCLARKALRALKGLVKLQAMVRGCLVRKQANATFHSMQALMRSQATARSRRTTLHHPLPENATTNHRSQSRKYMGKIDEIGDKFVGPTHSRRFSASLDVRTIETTRERLKIVEVDSARAVLRSRGANKSGFCYPTLSSTLPPSKINPNPASAPKYSRDLDEETIFDECRWFSSQSTSEFSGTIGSDNFLGEPFSRRRHPSYMASTRSSKAKLRSLSAPRQRPELHDLKRRLSLSMR